jgi:hypothetical protein
MQPVGTQNRTSYIRVLLSILLLPVVIMGIWALTAAPPRSVHAQEISAVPIWSSTENDYTTSVAWGDVDGDGDLDLAVGNRLARTRLYLSENGTLLSTPAWNTNPESLSQVSISSIAWGDVDGDGDLDLAVGDNGGANRLYRNDEGMLTTDAVWVSEENDHTTSIAWGDSDGDGDLDLVVGNNGVSNRLYHNESGMLATRAVWSSDDASSTSSVAWGDVDGDGDLDLAAGNDGVNHLYRNDSGTLQSTATWSSEETDNTTSVAWEDVDSDGDLDLAVGNEGVNHLYINNGGTLQTAATWSSEEADTTTSVAWGDIDNNGTPDLLAGNRYALSKLYYNINGTLATTGTTWNTFEGDLTNSVAWGDVDNDGDLDLAIGNGGQPNRLYRNDAIGLQTYATWTATDDYDSTSVAWGDVDNDGDLDLAIGNGSRLVGYPGQPDVLYLNDKGTLATVATWESNENDDTSSVAWGDVDGDGDLDLAVGNDGEPNRLYRNDGGTLTPDAVWSSLEAEQTSSVAWGDVDGDGDLDLAVGNDGEVNRLYLNNGSTLSISAVWGTADDDDTLSVAWGDVDGDGDLDLAVGNDGDPNRLYLNNGGTLQTSATWSSQEPDVTTSIAWGDVDGDGDLDLAVGNLYTPNRLYRNDNGMLTTSGVWRSLEAEATSSVAWGDVDGDGDLDLAVGNFWPSNHVYRNDGGTLSSSAAWSTDEAPHTMSVAWGDVDGDGDLDLATVSGKSSVSHPEYLYINQRDARTSTAPIPTVHSSFPIGLGTASGSANFFSSAHIWADQTIAFDYILSHPDSWPVKEIAAFYSLDGGDNWLPATPAADTQTSNLTTSPGGVTHTYTWDVYASGVMGNSDNVVFRLVAIPSISPATASNHVSGPYLRGSYATMTFPLRVRGTQVRVLQETDTPANGAFVYLLPEERSSGATPLSNQQGQPFTTDIQGYLQGRGQIQTGDRLVALFPTETTGDYTLFNTSAAPNEVALDYHQVETPGLQTLTVSPQNPLMLFDLEVSLEWDASQDERFMSRLSYDLARTSELLYDWTNGQAALGNIAIFHDRTAWHDANIRIYSSNRLRPNANQGGITDETFSVNIDTRTLPYLDHYETDVITITYEPGQVRMGVVWSRFGGAEGNLSEDWPRTLAHELGHYALYLDDNYVGLDENSVIIPVESCPGAMSDQYNDDYGEFHPSSGWLPDCHQTFSNVSTGRSDWETITTFYPFLHPPQTSFLQVNRGPTILPLEVTHAQFEPITPTELLDVPIFYLKNEQGGRLDPLPDNSARAFLFQHDEQGNEWITDLGRPMRDQMTAWGAHIGGRVCMYEPSRSRLGCHDPIEQGDEHLTVSTIDNWQPDIVVSPVTSHTIAISVVNAPANETMKARLFPSGEKIAAEQNEQTLVETSTGGDSSTYAATFELEEPVIQGYVHAWVEETGEQSQQREMVVDYAMGGNPGSRRSRGGSRRSRGGSRRSRSSPAVSSDGQVMLFGDNLEFEEGEFYTLQTATNVGDVPSWTTPVGQAYRISASPRAPDLEQTSLSIGYQQRDVPDGEEEWLKIYYRPVGGQWQRLDDTLLDTEQNLASAPTRGAGLYMVMSSIEIHLDRVGWNLFSYPVGVEGGRPVEEALQSIANFQWLLYSYEPETSPTAWKLYANNSPGLTGEMQPLVNTLDRLYFGRGYWLYSTSAMTVYLKGDTEETGSTALTDGSFPPEPPATYYTTMPASDLFQPGTKLTAWISSTNQLCGESQLQPVGNKIGVVIHVLADGPEDGEVGHKPGCGMPGRQVIFKVGDEPEPVWVLQWDNTRLTHLDGFPIYLPMITR